MLDPLEHRRLFAIPVSGGVATVSGTASNDVLEIINNSGTLQVRNSAGTVIDSVSMSGITRIDVNGGSGNDYIRMGRSNGTLIPGVASILAGNGGNDTLIGGNLADQLFGAAGNDRLDGRAGKDVLNGGTEFDTADYAARTVPVKVSLANSSTGNDGSASGDNSSAGVYNDQGGDNCVDVEAAIGGAGADILVGSASANWLEGSGGNDSMYGGDGNDTLTGGANSSGTGDLGYGEGGDDYFFMADSFGEKFLGGLGTTFAQYDSGPTYFDAAAPASFSIPTTLSAATTLSSARTTSTTLAATLTTDPPPDVDVVLTSDNLQGNYYIGKNGKPVPLFAYTDKGKSNAIPDYLVKRVQALQPDGTLLVSGSELADTITVTQSDGLVEVSVNGELYIALASAVTKVQLLGNGGDDSVTVDSSVTVPVEFDGGNGTDAVTVNSASSADSYAVSATSAAVAVTGGASTISITASESLILNTGEGNDAVTINDGVSNLIAVSVSGGDGIDAVTVYGGATDDTFAVNPGSIAGQVVVTRAVPASAYSVTVSEGEQLLISTGDGNDAIAVGTLNSPIAISVIAGGGNDTINDGVGDSFLSGGTGNDTLYGGAGADLINSGDGNDVVFAGDGNDSISTDAGDDTVYAGNGADQIDSGDGNDTVYGEDGNDSINAGAGNDLAYGGTGLDQLAGEDGNDLLFGEADDDSLVGGVGRDILVGGNGADSLDGGVDDDLLIAGSTSHDHATSALAAIQAEWTSTNAFSNRVANLNGLGEGGGLNGNYYLRPGGTSNKTVFEDTTPAADVLTGGAGSDWFLAATQGLDSVLDLSNPDKLTQAS